MHQTVLHLKFISTDFIAAFLAGHARNGQRIITYFRSGNITPSHLIKAVQLWWVCPSWQQRFEDCEEELIKRRQKHFGFIWNTNRAYVQLCVVLLHLYTWVQCSLSQTQASWLHWMLLSITFFTTTFSVSLLKPLQAPRKPIHQWAWWF